MRTEVLGAIRDTAARGGATLLPLVRHDSTSVFHRLMASQWWSEEQIRALQEQRLGELLRHACREVPYYRDELMQAGVDPRTVTLDRIGELPILERETIQQEGRRLLARGRVPGQRGVIENHTGGSTGQPITFYQDPTYFAHTMAELRRNYHFCGYREGDRQAFLWGSDYDSRDHRSLRGRAKDYFKNLLWLNTFDLTEESLRSAHQRLAAFQPTLLVGYVSSLVLLATTITANRLSPITPRAVQSSAEVLTADQRLLLEDAFGCPVFDRYGCREVGNIAHECEAHTGLHILAENNIVEVVRDDGTPATAGELGHVVVTNLNNKTMPLIRYRLGDLAVRDPRPCSCGRGLPRLRSVQGRSSDVITAPGGRLLHGEFFTHLFYKIDGVRQFRVEQTTLRHLVVEIAPGPSFSPTSLDFLTHSIHQHGDPAFEIEYVIRDTLAPTKSGKFRFTTSRIRPTVAAQP